MTDAISLAAAAGIVGFILGTVYGTILARVCHDAHKDDEPK